MAITKCTKCGAPIEFDTATKFARCSYCESQIYIDRSGAGFFYILPFQPGFQDLSSVYAAFKRWAAGSRMAKDLEINARITRAIQQYFPVYMFKRDINGSEKIMVEPAKSTTLPGLHGLKIPAGDIKIFDQKFDVGGVELLKPDMDMTAYLPNLPGKPIEQALVYFPIWFIEYWYAGRRYNLVIDGSGGETFATDFPHRAETPYIAVGVSGFGLFVIEGILMLWNPLIGIITALATVPAIFGASYYVATKH